eukprot:TRINITY_DN2465_c0_g1_i1.p1 TRINITY_DN2465_c0_g1~~TRINITY_DN2465_c0_g1_i1.p1  ORF type:complete len:174 (+),score=30.68 TRINITY_DN2465_c0_g1_i1:120-641(+)
MESVTIIPSSSTNTTTVTFTATTTMGTSTANAPITTTTTTTTTTTSTCMGGSICKFVWSIVSSLRSMFRSVVNFISPGTSRYDVLRQDASAHYREEDIDPNFVNQGYITWLEARRQWCAIPEGKEKKLARIITKDQRDLLWEDISSRDMLTEKAPLKEVVITLHDIWEEDDFD